MILNVICLYSPLKTFYALSNIYNIYNILEYKDKEYFSAFNIFFLFCMCWMIVAGVRVDIFADYYR